MVGDAAFLERFLFCCLQGVSFESLITALKLARLVIFFSLKAHSFSFFSAELNFAETEAASVQKQQEVFKQIDVSIL